MSPARSRLSPGEQIVWSGSPPWRRFATDVFRLHWVAVYFGVLVALRFYEGWKSGATLGETAVNAIPLAGLFFFTLANLAWLARAMARSTSYVVTNRRVIIRYGVAIRATLALPFSRIARISLALGRDGTGDLLLELKPSERLPFVKLWPLTCAPWRALGAHALLRGVPDAAVVGGLFSRAVTAAATDNLRLQAQASNKTRVSPAA